MESTPSLVGYSLRSVQDQETLDSVSSLASSRSPSKSNQKKGITHHDDYTSVNELVDEGALIHDEQAYDDLLDESGKLRPAVSHSQTLIPGVEQNNDDNDENEVPLIKSAAEKLSKPSKPSARSKEIKLEDLEPEAKEDDSKPQSVSSGASSTEPQQTSGKEHSIYELKNSDGANDMSLEDLIDSQIASMSEISTDFQKRISEKKTKPKVLESSRSRSRRKSNSGIIPESVIENDSLQQVPAGAREGVYSPLVQSRSQSAIRPVKRDNNSSDSADKPHLARGESYKGAHSEYRPGRKPVRDDDDAISQLSQPSKDYLRSVSRSRSRVPNEPPISNRELSEEGALISDPEHRFDMDVARDDAIDHLHHDVLKEESDEDEGKDENEESYQDEKEEKLRKPVKPVHDENENVEEIEKEPKEKVATEAGTDVQIPKKVPKLADFENEEITTPEDSGKDEEEVTSRPDNTGDIKEEPVIKDSKEEEKATEKDSPKENEAEEEAKDATPLKAIPGDEQTVGSAKEEEEKDFETKEETASSDSKPTEDKDIKKETVDTETGQTVDIPDKEDDVLSGRKEDNTTEPEILPKDAVGETIEPNEVKEEAEHAKKDEVEQDPIEPKEGLKEPDQEKQEEAVEKLDDLVNETAESKPGKKEADVEIPLKLKNTEKEADDEGNSKEGAEDEESEVSTSKVDDPAGEAERLIKELDDAIGGEDDSLTGEGSEQETTKGKHKSAEDLSHIKQNDQGDSEVNVIDKESNSEAKAVEEPAELPKLETTDSEPEAKKVEEPAGTPKSKDPKEEPKEISEATPDAKAVEEPAETPKSKDPEEEPEEEPEEIHEPSKEEIIEMLKNESVYLYTSLAGGGFHMPTRTNKLATILTGNRIPFTYRDLGTDEQARNVWRRYSRGRTLPAVVRGKDDIIGNWEEIEEANEDYRVRELIYETL